MGTSYTVGALRCETFATKNVAWKHHTKTCGFFRERRRSILSNAHCSFHVLPNHFWLVAKAAPYLYLLIPLSFRICKGPRGAMLSHIYDALTVRQSGITIIQKFQWLQRLGNWLGYCSLMCNYELPSSPICSRLVPKRNCSSDFKMHGT